MQAEVGRTATPDKRVRSATQFRWLILALALVMSALAYSMRYSFSVFYVEILKEFNWTRAETAGAFSLSLLVYGASSPFVGSLVDRVGPRRVLISGAAVLGTGLLVMSLMQSVWLFYLLIGVVMAAGINALGFATHLAYLPNWFVSRRGLAFGVISAAIGTSYLLISLYQYLISSLTWRPAYIVLGLITFAVVIPLAVFFVRARPKGQVVEAAPEKVAEEAGEGSRTAERTINAGWTARDWTLRRALSTRRFWFMFALELCLSTTANFLLAHQPIHMEDLGFSPLFAASVFSLMGAFSIAGNCCGFVSDRLGREGAYTVGTVLAIIGTLAIALTSTSQSWLAMVYVVFWGMAYGLCVPSSMSSLADLFAGKHFGAINGFFLLAFGIGGAIGPWLGGYLFDRTGSYSLGFLAAGIIFSLSCLFIWMASPRKVRAAR